MRFQGCCSPGNCLLGPWLPWASCGAVICSPLRDQSPLQACVPKGPGWRTWRNSCIPDFKSDMFHQWPLLVFPAAGSGDVGWLFFLEWPALIETEWSVPRHTEKGLDMKTQVFILVWSISEAQGTKKKCKHCPPPGERREDSWRQTGQENCLFYIATNKYLGSPRN